MEPFVPKTGPTVNGQMACFMVNQQGGFSLDAPEFVPNLYGQPNGEMYTWVPNQVGLVSLLDIYHHNLTILYM